MQDESLNGNLAPEVEGFMFIHVVNRSFALDSLSFTRINESNNYSRCRFRKLSNRSLTLESDEKVCVIFVAKK